MESVHFQADMKQTAHGAMCDDARHGQHTRLCTCSLGVCVFMWLCSGLMGLRSIVDRLTFATPVFIIFLYASRENVYAFTIAMTMRIRAGDETANFS